MSLPLELDMPPFPFAGTIEYLTGVMGVSLPLELGTPSFAGTGIVEHLKGVMGMSLPLELDTPSFPIIGVVECLKGVMGVSLEDRGAVTAWRSNEDVEWEVLFLLRPDSTQFRWESSFNGRDSTDPFCLFSGLMLR